MKILSTTLLFATAAMLSVSSYPAFGQTQDGVTPAEESVCDPLKEDGVTKGLYGLCIAFSEAHDAADENVPLTPEEAAALEESIPAGRILRNYNKKKQPGDPDMPSINIEEAGCPCWTTEQLDSIDGWYPDSTGTYVGGGCGYSLPSLIYRSPWEGGPLHYAAAHKGGANYCFYRNYQVSPAVDLTLWVSPDGPLTPENLDICLQEARDLCISNGWLDF